MAQCDPVILFTQMPKGLLRSSACFHLFPNSSVQDILADREDIAKSMLSTLDAATDSWGVRVERVEIKDVKLPQQLQRAMAAEAEASRQAKAKVIV